MAKPKSYKKRLPKYSNGGPPVNGKHQADILNAKTYLTSMANSPLFAERYQKMTGETNPEVIERARQNILSNISNTGVDYISPFAMQMRGSKGFMDYDKNKLFLSERIKNKDLTASDILTHELSHGSLPMPNPDDIQQNKLSDPRFGNIINLDQYAKLKKQYEQQFSPFVDGKPNERFTREFRGTPGIFERRDAFILAGNRGNLSSYEDEMANQFFNYLTDPTEIKSRVDVGRRFLKDKGLYDPTTQRFTDKDYDNLKKEFENLPRKQHKEKYESYGDIFDLLYNYPKEDVINMFNSFVSNKADTNKAYAKYGGRLNVYAPGGETDDPRKRMAAEAAKRKSSIALPDISFVQPSGKETGYLKEEEKKEKISKREADIARVMKNPAIKSRKQAEDFLKMKAKEAYRGPDQLRETPEAQSKIGKFIDVAAHPGLALDIYRTTGTLPDYFAEKPIPGVTGLMDFPYSFTGLGTAAGIAKAGKDLPSQIMEGDWAGMGTNLLSIVPGLRNIKGITKKGLKNIVKPFRGLDDINLNLSTIESAGSNAEKIKLINKLKSQGIISENINTDKLIEYPNLLNLATKKGIQNKLTFQRAVRPFEQAVTSEGKISTLSAADEAALASKAGTSEAAKAMYMASHIPAQKYGARSGLEHLPSDLDALYLSKLKAGETPTPNLTYGPYSTKVRYPFDFSKGSAEDWYKQYSKLPFKGEQIYDPKTGTSSWKFPAAVSGKVQPGDIYDWYNVNDGYGAVIGKPGTKALEPVYTEFNPKMAELEKAQLEHDQMLDLFKANKPEDLDFYLNYMKEKYPNVDVSNVKNIQEAYPRYAKHLSEQLKLSKQEPTERMYYSPLEHGFKYGGYKYNNMAGKLNRRKGLPGNFPRYEGGSTTTSNIQGFNPLSLVGPAIGLMGAFQQPKGQMDYGTSDYFQDQNQAEGQSKAATAAIARGLSFVPGWGQAASLGLQGAQALSGLVGQKDAYGMAPTGFQQGASALLDPVGSLVSAAHGQNPFSRKEKMREVGSLYQDMSAQKTTDQQDAYTQNVKAAEGQYLAYGGYMPYYALGGRARYFNGGRMANPYAKEPNAEIENEVVDHANGGIQDFSHLPRHENATEKNLVNMEDGSFVFSNRIKNPATGNYFAKDAKPLNTLQQEKILADGNTTPLTVNGAKLMIGAKKLLSNRLKELHEATKTYNGAQKAENEATEEFIGMLGGMYGKGGLIKRKDGSYSPRGLWDNIRANRGSGKKPTKAMLEQERKIKAKEKAMGGYMYADGGTYVTAGDEYHRIYKNAEGDIMVNHPKEDKGKWDTINLTNKAGAKTVAQGVAATKKWHRENPEYAYGGYALGESYDLSDAEIKELKRQGYTFDIE